jgi:hypothetical protein
LGTPEAAMGTYISLLFARHEWLVDLGRPLSGRELTSPGPSGAIYVHLRNYFGDTPALREASDAASRFVDGLFSNEPDALRADPRVEALMGIELEYLDVFGGAHRGFLRLDAAGARYREGISGVLGLVRDGRCSANLSTRAGTLYIWENRLRRCLRDGLSPDPSTERYLLRYLVDTRLVPLALPYFYKVYVFPAPALRERIIEAPGA